MATPPEGGWTKLQEERARAAGYDSWQAWVDELEAEEAVGHSGKKGPRGPICGRTADAKGLRGGPRPCTRGEAEGVEHRDTGSCWRHGRGLPGETNPNFKNGSGSKYAIRGSIRDRVEEVRKTSAIEALEEGQAALLVRLFELYDRIDEAAPGGEGLGRAREILGELRSTDDEARAIELLTELDGIVRRGERSGEVWEELYDVVDNLRKVAEARRKLFVDFHQAVEIQRVEAFVESLARAMIEEAEITVSDEKERKELQRGVFRVFSEYLGPRRRREIPAKTEGG